jgi:HAD superfamily hydrolase (TIGR01490 family)
VRKAVAVFDIDGTLLSGSSAERIFIQHLMSRGELSLVNAARFLKHLVVTLPRNWAMATKGNRFYLRGKSSRHIEELAGECFRRDIVCRISALACRKIEEHRASGLEIILLSGTLDVLLRLFQEYLEADHAHGSTLEVSGGRYTGAVCGVYPYGRGKAEIVRTEYGGGSYDLSASHAYANHVSDFEFLRLFGHSALVNPSPRLSAIAKARGIGTVSF